MRVIVCGGRDYDDWNTLEFILDCNVADGDTIVHGGARGADEMAGEYAALHGIRVEVHPADWKTHGRAAGPIRNKLMLGAGADLVIAFPGGRGTAHMVSIAEKAGVPVVHAVNHCGSHP